MKLKNVHLFFFFFILNFSNNSDFKNNYFNVNNIFNDRGLYCRQVIIDDKYIFIIASLDSAETSGFRRSIYSFDINTGAFQEKLIYTSESSLVGGEALYLGKNYLLIATADTANLNYEIINIDTLKRRSWRTFMERFGWCSKKIYI